MLSCSGCPSIPKAALCFEFWHWRYHPYCCWCVFGGVFWKGRLPCLWMKWFFLRILRLLWFSFSFFWESLCYRCLSWRVYRLVDKEDIRSWFPCISLFQLSCGMQWRDSSHLHVHNQQLIVVNVSDSVGEKTKPWISLVAHAELWFQV